MTFFNSTRENYKTVEKKILLFKKKQPRKCAFSGNQPAPFLEMNHFYQSLETRIRKFSSKIAAIENAWWSRGELQILKKKTELSWAVDKFCWAELGAFSKNLSWAASKFESLLDLMRVFETISDPMRLFETFLHIIRVFETVWDLLRLFWELLTYFEAI